MARKGAMSREELHGRAFAGEFLPAEPLGNQPAIS